VIEVSSFKRPNRVSTVSSFEDGNRSSFRKVLPSSLLEFRTMNKALKPNDSDSYAPSSESFRLYLNLLVAETVMKCLTFYGK
jgi:hypothetical protein